MPNLRLLGTVGSAPQWDLAQMARVPNHVWVERTERGLSSTLKYRRSSSNKIMGRVVKAASVANVNSVALNIT